MFLVTILNLANWIKSLALTKLDEEILLADGELTANHISGGQLLLRRLHPQQEGLNDTSYLCDKLLWQSKPVSFIQIIHVKGNHWACLSNRFCSHANEVELFDSLHNHSLHKSRGPDCSILDQACAILKSPAKSITINVVNVQQQYGSTQCGLYALAFAADLCENIDPFSRVYYESRFRSHLLTCFLSEKIAPFPSRRRRSVLEERVTKISVTDIFCICRLPEKLPMACCDACCEWYHPSCMEIEDEVFSDPNMKWWCDGCNPGILSEEPTSICSVVTPVFILYDFSQTLKVGILPGIRLQYPEQL